MPVYREDLRWPPLRCEAPSCVDGHHEDEMWFHPACHRASPLRVRRDGDLLTLACARCDRDVVSLAIVETTISPRGGWGDAAPKA